MFATAVVIGVGYRGVDIRGRSKVTAADVRFGASTDQTTAYPEKPSTVLPSVALGEQHEQEYFSDELTEVLIDLLSKMPTLRVPARVSSF